MPEKKILRALRTDVKPKSLGKVMDNPIVKGLIYRLPHGREGYEAAQAIAGQLEKNKELVTTAKATVRQILDDFTRRQRRDPGTRFVMQGLEDMLVESDETPRTGDMVIMTSEANPHYGRTVEGSYGILKEVAGKSAVVEFHHVTGLTPLIGSPELIQVSRDHYKKAILKGEQLGGRNPAELKVGDKVQISEGSKYYGQNEGQGQIIGTDPFNAELPFIVRFQNGEQNNYALEDLEIFKKAKHDKRTVRGGLPEGKHDEKCFHDTYIGKAVHCASMAARKAAYYLTRVTVEHLVGAAVGVAAMSAAQWAIGRYDLKDVAARLFREGKAAQTVHYYESNKPVLVEPSIFVTGGTEKANVPEQQVLYTTELKKEMPQPETQPQMLDAETLNRFMKVY